MYNESQKTEFIRQYTSSLSTAAYIQRLFDYFEPYEQIWGADLCTKSTEELQPVFDGASGVRTSSRWMSLSILREYVKWCIANRIPGAQDGALRIKVTGLDKVRKRMVSGPLDLQCYLDQVFRPESEETIDTIYRCYFWLAFCGVEEDDALTITKDSIDLRSMTIQYNDMALPIYRESLPALRNAMELTSFAYHHPNYLKEIRRERVAGNNIMRGVKSTLTNKKVTRSHIYDKQADAIKLEKTDRRPSYFPVSLSGLFYRIYERERAGIQPDFSEAAYRHMSGKTYKAKSLRAKQTALARDYMNDYIRWKMAFSI